MSEYNTNFATADTLINNLIEKIFKLEKKKMVKLKMKRAIKIKKKYFYSNIKNVSKGKKK